jgi:hypothetical protein
VIQNEWLSIIPKDLTHEDTGELVLVLWQKEQREFHYVAMDFMAKWKDKEILLEDIDFIEFYSILLNSQFYNFYYC